MNGDEAVLERDEEFGGAADGVSIEEKHRMRLQWIRNAPRTMDDAVIRAAQALAAKLNREIEQGHDAVAFSIALILAAAKDGMLDLVLDFVGIGEIPIIGQLPGLFVSLTLAYFLWGKGWFNTWKIKIVYYIFALLLDNLPLLNNLPMTVLTVLWAWHVVRHRMHEAADELENLKNEFEQQIETVEET